jgi:hypothetical protein
MPEEEGPVRIIRWLDKEGPSPIVPLPKGMGFYLPGFEVRENEVARLVPPKPLDKSTTVNIYKKIDKRNLKSIFDELLKRKENIYLGFLLAPMRIEKDDHERKEGFRLDFLKTFFETLESVDDLKDRKWLANNIFSKIIHGFSTGDTELEQKSRNTFSEIVLEALEGMKEDEFKNHVLDILSRAFTAPISERTAESLVKAGQKIAEIAGERPPPEDAFWGADYSKGHMDLIGQLSPELRELIRKRREETESMGKPKKLTEGKRE